MVGNLALLEGKYGLSRREINNFPDLMHIMMNPFLVQFLDKISIYSRYNLAMMSMQSCKPTLFLHMCFAQVRQKFNRTIKWRSHIKFTKYT